MPRASRLQLAIRLTLAFLVALGTSAQGVAALLCGTDLCPKRSMELAATSAASDHCSSKRPAQAPGSCEEPSEKGGACCCKAKTTPDLAGTTAKAALTPAGNLDLGLAPNLMPAELPLAPKRSVPIPFSSDSSPPGGSSEPYLGRAPPVA